MDAEELKVVLEEIRNMHSAEIAQLQCLSQQTTEAVCEKRGPHEYIDDNSYASCIAKVCKFCGKNKGRG